MIEQLTSLDQLEITINGASLDPATARKRLNYNDCWLDFDVASLLKPGNNSLQLKVKERNPHVLAPHLLAAMVTGA